MRNLILAVVPVIALTALPALAQSSASESTTTTTTAVPAPVGRLQTGIADVLGRPLSVCHGGGF